MEPGGSGRAGGHRRTAAFGDGARGDVLLFASMASIREPSSWEEEKVRRKEMDLGNGVGLT